MSADVIIIEDRQAGRTEVVGTQIGKIDTRDFFSDDDQPARWSENIVIKLASTGYVLWRAGKSVIYHRSPTKCETRAGAQRGSVTTVGELPPYAEPCEICKPQWPEEMDPDDKVRFEFPRNTIDRCATPAQVVEKLSRMRRFDASEATAITEPTRALLDQCAENDPDWVLADLPTQRIS